MNGTGVPVVLHETEGRKARFRHEQHLTFLNNVFRSCLGQWIHCHGLESTGIWIKFPWYEIVRALSLA